MNRRPFFVISITIFVLFFSSVADAYLDPASGSMILQVIVAAIAAAAITVKAFWHRIRGAFGARKSDGVESEETPESNGSAG